MNSQSDEHDQLRVVRNITYGNILSGETSHHDVYKAQVCEWIFRPARHLAALRAANPNDTDHAMALLSLLVLFFEPHGQYLSGQDSKNASEAAFINAFSKVLAWLVGNGRLDNQASNLDASRFYRFARCGLLHSAQFKKEFLVGFQSQSFAPNQHLRSCWLVNPWRLLEDLEEYFDYYYRAVSDSLHPEYAALRPQFDATFNRLVLEVLKTYV